jgi:hypothetical protein
MSMIHQMVALSKEQLDHLLSRPEEVGEFIERQDERIDECSLYKSWHCMHFLLNGHPWNGEIPYGWAVFGGSELGSVDVGYGPARYLLPEQVEEVAEGLGKLPPDDLFEAYAPEAMRRAELYCAPDEGDEEDEERSLREYYERLCGFYERAAKDGYGVLTWLH